ncbi:cysteine hydrolase family protein [Sphingobacterium paludis]|uniref:Nicotinamidase-related amidase n=1 Tax=Sphingobacterium paludis TaxID=1476465 RepID=A0A4R7CYY7_9SPHI|nr:hypothetical protein [Sphingobacterium paludis]TDS11736.1 nicotinamidase-related amidase [Sphingobacterium paludis]
MKATYDDIVDVQHIASFDSNEKMGEILALGQAAGSLPAAQEARRTLLLAIDVQNDFMEGIGSLAVPGSRADVQRLTQWMYRNLNALSQVICSLDCHAIMQIFHPAWWLDQDNKHPDPFTIITYEAVARGMWRAANGETDRSLEYLFNLESSGKKQLCIWPYHCLEGTAGAKLESEFTKMLYFHAAARRVTPKLVYKGQDPYSEMYGIIQAEYDRDGFVNQEVLDAIREYDAIYIAGQASSHCVLASAEQILAHYESDRSVTSRITLLEDCMSPIGGFEESTKHQFNRLRERYGIQIRKSTEILL